MDTQLECSILNFDQSDCKFRSLSVNLSQKCGSNVYLIINVQSSRSRSNLARDYNYYYTIYTYIYIYIFIVDVIINNILAELRVEMYIKNRHIFIF